LINSQQPDKGSILDIGAGTGDFYGGKREWLENRVEPSDKARAIALKKQFLCRRHLGIRKSLFDVITMWHVLEHVPNLDE
jgi:2-polyprenyl-3-methyl-5-hydroxy-6-metoxy-1,4-benzoquinol methylase